MKSLIRLTFVCLLLLHSAQSKAQHDSLSPAHIGIVYPLSSNGKMAGQMSNRFSFHLLSGYSKGEQGFALSGLANVIREDAQGVQIAGLSNQIGRNASGVQLAGLGNSVKGDAPSAMIAGIYNVANNAHSQISGILNLTKSEAKAVQIAGLVNISAGNVTGLQVSGLINKSRDVNSQLGGLVNVAGRVRGVQVSGFLNIADSSDYAIGLINLVKNGEKSFGLQLDETLTTTLVFRSGGRKMYTLLGVGYNERPGNDRFIAFEAGLGKKWDIAKNFRVKGELVSRSITQDFDDDVRFTSTLRALPTLLIARRIELFGGPSFNHSYFERSDSNFPLPKKYIWENSHPEHFHGLYVGWTAGVQVLF
jgi:hypothetical protein